MSFYGRRSFACILLLHFIINKKFIASFLLPYESHGGAHNNCYNFFVISMRKKKKDKQLEKLDYISIAGWLKMFFVCKHLCAGRA